MGNNVSANEETVLPKKHFAGNRRWRMVNLANGGLRNLTTESSQRCFLGAQTGKHLLRNKTGKQNVSEENQRHFLIKTVSETNVSIAS